MSIKQPKILYFVNGSAPSAADQLAVIELGVSVFYRNARFVGADEKPEPCDGVAGHVPAAYADIPSAEDAMTAYKAALEEQRERLGETAAPVPTKGGKKATKDEKKPDGPEGSGNPAWNPGAA